MSEFDDREEEHDEDEDDIEYTIKVSFILLTHLFRISDCIFIFRKLLVRERMAEHMNIKSFGLVVTKILLHGNLKITSKMLKP